MACPGGCFNGGGMPLTNDIEIEDVVALRTASLYANNVENVKNADTINKTYEEFLQNEDSQNAHTYCHTHYTQKAFTKE